MPQNKLNEEIATLSIEIVDLKSVNATNRDNTTHRRQKAN